MAPTQCAAQWPSRCANRVPALLSSQVGKPPFPLRLGSFLSETSRMVCARSLLPTRTPILSSYQLEALCLVLSKSALWRAGEFFLSKDTPTPDCFLTFTHILPVLGSASKDVQFGSIDDNSPPPSLSPAAPSTLMDQKQVRTFGRISATPKPPTASTLPTVTKPVVSLSGPSPTAASSAGPTVKKINIHKLFQQPSGASSDPIPRQVPHSMGEQSMPARMMQWQSRYYPIVSSITVKPLLIHPPLLLRPQRAPPYWLIPPHPLTQPTPSKL